MGKMMNANTHKKKAGIYKHGIQRFGVTSMKPTVYPTPKVFVLRYSFVPVERVLKGTQNHVIHLSDIV